MGKLLCGAARRDITPGMDIIYGIRGLMGQKYSGIHDPLSLRAIAFSDGENKALILQLDMDKDQDPDRVISHISEKFGFPEENILYFGIHTHTAPLFFDRLRTGWIDEDVERCSRLFEQKVLTAMDEAIEEAVRVMRPAKIGCGRAQSYTNCSRVEDFEVFDENGNLNEVISTQGHVPEAPISHEFFVMEAVDMEEKPIAFLMNFPMHCAVMFLNALGEDGRNVISSDVGGNLSRAVEARFPGSVAAWSSGAAGDINPLVNSFGNYIDPFTNTKKEYKVVNPDTILDFIVGRQFVDVMHAIHSIPYFSSKADIKGGITWANTPSYGLWINQENGHKKLLKDQIDPEGFKIRLQTLRIGDLLFAGIGGELFDSHAKMLKELSPVRNTVVINHCASLYCEIGYIHDDATIARGYTLLPGIALSVTVPGYVENALREKFIGLINED